jgi:hypothetical protein
MNIAVNHSAPLSVKNMMKATLFLNHKIGAEWRIYINSAAIQEDTSSIMVLVPNSRRVNAINNIMRC